MFVCSAAGGGQHWRPRDGSACAPEERLPQSLYSPGRSTWASEQDPWGVFSLSVCSPLWNVFHSSHSSQKTKNCKLKPLFNLPQSQDFYMEMKWEFTSWSKFYLKIPLYNWPCVDVCNVVVYIAFPSFPSPSRFPGLSQWRVSDLEEWGQPACGRHSARLREHDLDQRSSELHFQGRWWVPFSLSEAYTQLCPPNLCFSRPSHLLSRLLLCWLLFHSVCLCSLADVCTELMEVNHDEQVVDTERFDISREIEDVTLDSMQPAEQEVAKRLTTPIVNTFLDTRDIAFERRDPNRTLSCFSIV